MEKGILSVYNLCLRTGLSATSYVLFIKENPRKKALLRCMIKILTRVKMLAQRQPSPRLDYWSLKIFWCALDPVSWAFSETNKISCGPKIA